MSVNTYVYTAYLEIKYIRDSISQTIFVSKGKITRFHTRIHRRTQFREDSGHPFQPYFLFYFFSVFLAPISANN